MANIYAGICSMLRLDIRKCKHGLFYYVFIFFCVVGRNSGEKDIRIADVTYVEQR